MGPNIINNLEKVRAASREIRFFSAEQRSNALISFAELLKANTPKIIAANNADYEREKNKLSPSLLSRLVLDKSKVESLAKGIAMLAAQSDPVNKCLSKTLIDKNLTLEKTSVPIGVIAVIFESRPDVLPQLASLAIRSGNCLVLKGGSEAIETNNLMAELMKELPLFPDNWFLLSHDRNLVAQLLSDEKNIDLVIPRGSKELVKTITQKSLIPVLGHADGICHLYLDNSMQTDEAMQIIIDSKTQYPSACNALETLIIQKECASKFLTEFLPVADSIPIKIHSDKSGKEYSDKFLDLPSSGWSTEYSENSLSIKIVESLEEAIDHINRYGSGHTDGILSNDSDKIEKFISQVDSASTMVNCSTRFADGYRYGLGAEVGISTGKIHARGPVGIEGMMTYRWVLKGSGHKVSDYVGESAKEFLHEKLSVDS